MLANLRATPETENDWNEYTWAARTEMTRIRQAIQAQKGIILNEYCIDPLSPQFSKDFLQNIDRMNKDFSTVLGLQTEDLSDVDFDNKEQFGAWTNTLYQQIYAAEAALGV